MGSGADMTNDDTRQERPSAAGVTRSVTERRTRPRLSAALTGAIQGLCVGVIFLCVVAWMQRDYLRAVGSSGQALLWLSVAAGTLATALLVVTATPQIRVKRPVRDVVTVTSFVIGLLLLLSLPMWLDDMLSRAAGSRLLVPSGAVGLALLGILLLIPVMLCSTACFAMKSTPPRRRTQVVAALIVVVVVAVGSIVVVRSASLSADHQFAEATSLTPLGDSFDEIAYRIPSDTITTLNVDRAGNGFVLAEDTRVSAYDGATGDVRWYFDFAGTTKTDRELTISSQGSNDSIVVAQYGSDTVVFDAMTGRVLWRFSESSGPPVRENRQIPGDLVILRPVDAPEAPGAQRPSASQDHYALTGFDGDTGEISWSITLPCGPRFVEVDDVIAYSGCDGSTVHLVDAATGTPVIEPVDMGLGRRDSTPAVTSIGNGLLAVGYDGWTSDWAVTVMTITGEIVATVDTADGSWVTSPAPGLVAYVSPAPEQQLQFRELDAAEPRSTGVEVLYPSQVRTFGDRVIAPADSGQTLMSVAVDDPTDVRTHQMPCPVQPLLSVPGAVVATCDDEVVGFRQNASK